METSATLLQRLRQPGDKAAWSYFVELYTPLLFHWANRLGLQESDASDLIQELFVHLYRKLPEFQYEPSRSFRGWLHRVTLNLWRDRVGAYPHLTGVDDKLVVIPAADNLSNFEVVEYQQFLIHRALELLQDQFSTETIAAFRAYVLEGCPVEQVAEKFKITVNAVYLSKSRVIQRLRQELAGMID